MRIDGSCHCGRVRFEAEIAADGVSVCHCTDCQSLTGTAFRVSAQATGAPRLTSGTPRTYAKTADNGNRTEQHFCGDCGSPLLVRWSEHGEDRWAVRWGAIRQREALRPDRAIWLRSAVPWLDDVADLPARLGD